jgi:formylglycine-generating enzyme required for sulfatase activity
MRGGSWIQKATECRAAARGYIRPATASGSIGFRVACAAAKGR